MCTPNANIFFKKFQTIADKTLDTKMTRKVYKTLRIVKPVSDSQISSGLCLSMNARERPIIYKKAMKQSQKQLHSKFHSGKKEKTH